MQLDIQRAGMHLTEEMEEYIRERADFLLAFHPEILACRVMLEPPVPPRDVYQAEVGLHIPGQTVHAREHAEDLRTAILLAFESARRALAGSSLEPELHRALAPGA